MVYKSTNEFGPAYLTELLDNYTPRSGLRSANVFLWSVLPKPSGVQGFSWLEQRNCGIHYHKSVRWKADDELEEVRHFDCDPEERDNMSRVQDYYGEGGCYSVLIPVYHVSWSLGVCRMSADIHQI